MEMIEKITAAYPNLTKSEQRIAAYIVAAKEKLPQQTLAEIGKITETGDATIVRLCKKLGAQGFNDFKNTLQIEQTQPDLQSPSVIQKLESEICNKTAQLGRSIEEKKLKEFVRSMKLAQMTYIFGTCYEVSAALDLERCMLPHCRVKAVTDSYYLETYAQLAQAGDLIIVLASSHPYSQTAVEIAEASQATMWIVGHFDKPLMADGGDLQLQARYRETTVMADRLFFLMITELVRRSFTKDTTVPSGYIY